MPRPRIGLTAYRRSLPTALGERTDLYTLDPSYTDRVALAGGVPVILPHGEDPADVLAIVDGIVFTGGGDLHPEHYGEATAVDLEDADTRADRWELALVRAAREQRVPALGICRGMQTIAVEAGGRMVQDLLPEHGHPLIDKTPDALMGSRHDVTLEPDSRIAAVLGTEIVSVNSIHHQAVVDPGPYRATARLGDVVEALEATDEWRMIGVQWHPEKMPEPEQQRLFDALVADADGA